jgi:hypothetical protein
MTSINVAPVRPVRLPVLALLNPRQRTTFVLGSLGIALSAARYASVARRWLLWESAALFLVLMVPAAIVKWRDDVRRYGMLVTFAGVLLVVQGLHTIEHLIQWSQRHILNWSLRDSTGILSPANVEWLHFAWNTFLFLSVLTLVVKGMRGPFGWMALAWVFAHDVEHTYLFVRHLQVLAELRSLGVDDVTAQGLPGLLGRDGLLDRSSLTSGTLLCRIPFASTASRLDVHALWNTGDVVFLLPAVHGLLRRKIAVFAKPHES